MRDINRIDRICKKLAKFGKLYPDQRFGQLISNYLFTEGDPFFREDTRCPGVPDSGETGEEKLDKLIEERELFGRVVKETSYEVDYEKYMKADLAGMKKNPMVGNKKDQKTEFKAKPRIPEPVAPNGRDYIKLLK